MSDLPFMYKPMSERAFIRWALGYTMDRVIETFRAVPDEWLARRPRPNINAPGWVFGHIAVTERKHVGLALEGVDDIPREYGILHSGARPTEQEIADAIESKDALVKYWQDVRAKTERYLETITDDDLAGVAKTRWLAHAGPNRENPRREWFIMTIQHQNYHWGQLATIEKVIRSSS